MTTETDKQLQAIVKELKEMNRRLDRLCRASIFSLDEPIVNVKHENMDFIADFIANKD